MNSSGKYFILKDAREIKNHPEDVLFRMYKYINAGKREKTGGMCVRMCTCVLQIKQILKVRRHDDTCKE